MVDIRKGVEEFVDYWRRLEGDEKGEAHVFCDRLFRAFGHEGYKEAGARLEYRVREKGSSVKYADLVWPRRVLLEMKKRGENLHSHYKQALTYWVNLAGDRPRYVVLCNFDEFWVYDFDTEVREPVDKVVTSDLPDSYESLNFLLPENKPPIFGNNQVSVTRAAAKKLGRLFSSLVERGTDGGKAQRFILQSLVAMFAEDIGLIPHGLLTGLLDECRRGKSTYDLIGGLFRQMNRPTRAPAGRYINVPYFNGGIFTTVEALALNDDETDLLYEAAKEDWSNVHPAIFGNLFQSTMDQEERHTQGGHFTSMADIQQIVGPTIGVPWRRRIAAARTLKGLVALRKELLEFHVLDPACGSGNFLYVAYLELRKIEAELVKTAFRKAKDKERLANAFGAVSQVSAHQFHGIDSNSFATELAKVTLMLAKKLSLDEVHHILASEEVEYSLEFDSPIPLDNLDDNIRCEDALFCKWPEAHAIIGNPPYQGKNKMQQEFGSAYVNSVRQRYPDVPGMADYCVYWFRRAHDELPAGGRAGLVGTNTIRENYSREGGLDYITSHAGTITEAVSTQVWSGDAVVHVSIVNWVKGKEKGKKRLFRQVGDALDSPFEIEVVDAINPNLTSGVDVTVAKRLRANRDPKVCFQGQTHGHEGFLLSRNEAERLMTPNRKRSSVLFPYLTGDDLLSDMLCQPSRYVIDFHPRDLLTAKGFPQVFKVVETRVLPDRRDAAQEEEERNREARADDPDASVNRHHANFLKRWWLLSYAREELMGKIARVPRYVVCSRVTKRPVFGFVGSAIHPSDALAVFPFPDDYSFGILQSGMHWVWFTARCSHLKGDARYTSNTVFDSFPWPQSPKLAQVRAVARAAVALRSLRRQVMSSSKMSLRDLYRTLELPGKNPLRDAHVKLDVTVRAAYGMRKGSNPLAFLLKLNLELARREAAGEQILPPGLPSCVKKPSAFVTKDCVQLRKWPSS